MTRKKVPPRPTDTEFPILQVLWRHGPCVAGEVHEQVNRERPMGYTSVLKFLQIMVEKGLVFCDRRRRPFFYRAAQSEGQMQSQLVRDLAHRAFGGSAKRLVLRALSDKTTTLEELEEIERILAQMRRSHVRT